MTTRRHLHLDDYPLTLAVLSALFAHRLERAAEIGYEPTEEGAWVDFPRLVDESWLSSTEIATVRIAWGGMGAEYAGGLPDDVQESIRALIAEIAR